mmetsp:Transcript_70477/g.187694  ORF Transcript_70477/g.187694 Transcript_70477/m.187694 type:complete len:213 (-) Transcript_70477:2007-2645(-)
MSLDTRPAGLVMALRSLRSWGSTASARASWPKCWSIRACRNGFTQPSPSSTAAISLSPMPTREASSQLALPIHAIVSSTTTTLLWTSTWDEKAWFPRASTRRKPRKEMYESGWILWFRKRWRRVRTARCCSPRRPRYSDAPGSIRTSPGGSSGSTTKQCQGCRSRTARCTRLNNASPSMLAPESIPSSPAINREVSMYTSSDEVSTRQQSAV